MNNIINKTIFSEKKTSFSCLYIYYFNKNILLKTMESSDSGYDPLLEKQLTGHRHSITALSYNPNEHQLASSSLDHSILLWDLRGTMKSYRFQGHKEGVMDVTFSPSGKFMASASQDKTVRQWVPTVTGSTGMFRAHSQTVRSVQYIPDETKILTASDDKIIKIWHSDTQKFIASFVGHTNWVRRACISQDSSIIASCSDDKSIRLWNPETTECIHTYKDQKGHGMYLAWHPSSCYIAVGTSKGNVKLYDVRTHNLVQYYSIHDDAVTQLVFHPSGSYILTASKDGKIKILDLLEGHPIFTLSGHSRTNCSVNAVAVSPSGQRFATAGDSKQVLLWKTNFTELGGDVKENKQGNLLQQKSKGAKVWYQCYHSKKYPVINFVHIDNAAEINDSVRNASFTVSAPNANSTMIESTKQDQNQDASLSALSANNVHRNLFLNSSSQCESADDVGHINHIPRNPPTPTTYTIPSTNNNSIRNDKNQEGFFGLIQLRDHDVCYTSGIIEWVGRKRSFPVNSGFKILSQRETSEPLLKKVKSLNITSSSRKNNMKECDCAEVLPTVNAIVDHLNALHEAVDLVDLRLNTLEDAVGSN